MVLGPGSSRLIKASSAFVEEVQVRDVDSKGVFLYGFSDMPELTGETNWTVSSYMVVPSYRRKVTFLFLFHFISFHLSSFIFLYFVLKLN